MYIPEVHSSRKRVVFVEGVRYLRNTFSCSIRSCFKNYAVLCSSKPFQKLSNLLTWEIFNGIQCTYYFPRVKPSRKTCITFRIIDSLCDQYTGEEPPNIKRLVLCNGELDE